MRFLHFFTILFIIHSTYTQNISSIKSNIDGAKITYLKNSDSLFIKNIEEVSQSELFISAGLKANSSQRFLVWTKDSKSLIFEKEKNFKQSSLDVCRQK